MEQSHRDAIFKEKQSDFLWCLHCERTYRRGQWRTVDGYQMCPYPDCSADAVLDAWDWQTMRNYHPEYPEIPEPDTAYPAYPD